MTSTATIFLLIINTVLVFSSLNNPLIVTLPKGQIQGHVLKTAKNNIYYAFQEIPYAAPPVGALRFKEPVEPQGWKGFLNTTENTKICHQQGIPSSLLTQNVEQTEDCLYINVYTPVAPGGKKRELLPVMFLFHGGGFCYWDGTFQRYGPQFLIDQKVVVVAINYRLGPFGFLYTNDGLIPANLGLKDQNMALRWANENIALFGGDPEKITILGQSAGASSVGFHVVGKKSSGLFRAAIMQSGSSLCDFAHQPEGSYFAYRLGQALDPSLTTSNSTQELLEVLRSAPAEDMNNVTITDVPDELIHSYAGTHNTFWAPSIENPDDPNAFITNSTYEDLDSGNFEQVPLLIGFNAEESLVVFPFAENISGAAIDNNLVWAVGINFNLNSSSAEKAGELVRSIYTNSTFAEDYPALVRLVSEKLIDTCTLKHAELQSNFADVFVYQFSHRGPMAEINQNFETVEGKDVESVAHIEELFYLWSTDYNKDVSKFPDSDVLTLERLTKIWTNFAKYLNPTPEKEKLLDNIKWPKFKSDNMKFVNITETLDTKENPKNFARWREIIDEYGVRPFNI